METYILLNNFNSSKQAMINKLDNYKLKQKLDIEKKEKDGLKSSLISLGLGLGSSGLSAYSFTNHILLGEISFLIMGLTSFYIARESLIDYLSYKNKGAENKLSTFEKKIDEYKTGVSYFASNEDKFKNNDDYLKVLGNLYSKNKFLIKKIDKNENLDNLINLLDNYNTKIKYLEDKFITQKKSF